MVENHCARYSSTSLKEVEEEEIIIFTARRTHSDIMSCGMSLTKVTHTAAEANGKVHAIWGAIIYKLYCKDHCTGANTPITANIVNASHVFNGE